MSLLKPSISPDSFILHVQISDPSNSKRKYFIGGAILIGIIIALAIGLGVGLSKDDSSEPDASGASERYVEQLHCIFFGKATRILGDKILISCFSFNFGGTSDLP